MSKLLETHDLVTNFYTYEGVVRALNKVSLVVEKGSTFGLVGESGCGKSVTVRSVMRIVQEPGRVEGGRVLIFLNPDDETEAVELLTRSEAYMESLRGNRISMIFQEPNAALNPIMSICDQISESFLFHQTPEMSRRILDELDGRSGPWTAFLRLCHHRAAANPKDRLLKVISALPLTRLWRRRLKTEARRRSIDILARLGIPNPERIVDEYPHSLSGGMKQRIVIGIALACGPDLLIADEATSNLDVTIQAQILDLLARLKEEVISSVLLITHDLGVVAETCDKVGVMYAGNLVEVAPVRELFSNPLHPYTGALLEAVPRLSVEGELRSIRGNVPNLVEPPPGCRFHPRCGRVMDVCRTVRPELIDMGGDHQVACHLREAADVR